MGEGGRGEGRDSARTCDGRTNCLEPFRQHVTPRKSNVIVTPIFNWTRRQGRKFGVVVEFVFLQVHMHKEVLAIPHPHPPTPTHTHTSKLNLQNKNTVIITPKKIHF
jgi:hypothetical protein